MLHSFGIVHYKLSRKLSGKMEVVGVTVRIHVLSVLHNSAHAETLRGRFEWQ